MATSSSQRVIPAEIRILRGTSEKGEAQQNEIFATGLRQPFGIAFYPPGPDPQWVYVGNTDSSCGISLPAWRHEGAWREPENC